VIEEMARYRRESEELLELYKERDRIVAQTGRTEAELSELFGHPLDALTLAELRDRVSSMTQVEIAQAMERSQPNISRIEREENIELGTLRSYVEALGGKLEIHAVFGNDVYEVRSGAGGN
jgi:hypothetical protein